MNTFDHNKKAGMAVFGTLNGAGRDAVQPQALQEIIDILRYPFQTSCDYCNGLGYVRNGQDCNACDGTGKVIDDFFFK